MAALGSLRPAVASIARNPVLIVAAVAIALLQLPQAVVQTGEPSIYTVVSGVVSLVGLAVIPFLQAGLLAMAADGLDGRTGIGTFLDAGRANYVRMLLATIGFVAIVLVYVFGVLFGLLTVGFLVLVAVAAASGGLSGAFLVVLAVGALLAFLGYLGIILCLHFFGHAIVLDDAAVGDAFRESFRIVRRNLSSALGYGLILLAVGVVLTGPASVALTALSPANAAGVGHWLDLPDLGLPAFLGAVVVYVALTAIATAFWASYSVAFYTEVRDGAVRTKEDA